jgi:hypothetical protein
MVISCSDRRCGTPILSPTSPEWPSKTAWSWQQSSPTPCGAKRRGALQATTSLCAAAGATSSNPPASSSQASLEGRRPGSYLSEENSSSWPSSFEARALTAASCSELPAMRGHLRMTESRQRKSGRAHRLCPSLKKTSLRTRRYAAPLKFWPRIGRLRSRLPVAAKIAFVTAGWIMVAPGSPTPPHFLPAVGVRYTSVFGASLRRTTG